MQKKTEPRGSVFACSWLLKFQFLSHVGKRLYAFVYVRFAVGGGHLSSYTRLVFWHDGIVEAYDVNTLLQHSFRNLLTEHRVVKHNGYDGVILARKLKALETPESEVFNFECVGVSK